MKTIKFLIVIPTHNRNEILNDTIASIQKQSYKNWEMVISDNASTVPIKSTILVEYQKDSRINIIRREENPKITGSEHIELLLEASLKYQYDYIVVLADDDLLVPYALETVAECCKGHPFIGSSFISYYEKDKQLKYEKADYSKIQEVDSGDVLDKNLKSVGISSLLDSVQREENLIGSTHISTYFINKDLLNKTLSLYKKILVSPFGDVGYSKLAMEAKTILYINMPLAVIRYNNNYGMSGVKHRFLLSKHHDLTFNFSPVKAITFANSALESYLTLINDLQIGYRKNISILFYFKHIRQILRDSPFTKITFKDLIEALKMLSIQHLLEIMMLVFSFSTYRKILCKFKKDKIITVNQVESIWDAINYCVCILKK